MPRLRNVSSDAIVNVPEEKVARLGSEWEVVADEKPTKPKSQGKK